MKEMEEGGEGGRWLPHSAEKSESVSSFNKPRFRITQLGASLLFIRIQLVINKVAASLPGKRARGKPKI